MRTHEEQWRGIFLISNMQINELVGRWKKFEREGSRIYMKTTENYKETILSFDRLKTVTKFWTTISTNRFMVFSFIFSVSNFFPYSRNVFDEIVLSLMASRWHPFSAIFNLGINNNRMELGLENRKAGWEQSSDFFLTQIWRINKADWAGAL